MMPGDAIIVVTARHYGLSRADIRGRRIEAKVSWARQVAMWLIRESLNYELTRIGQLFDGRDHTTVLHALRRIDMVREADPAIRAEIDGLFAKVTGQTAPPLESRPYLLARQIMGTPPSARAVSGEQLGILCAELLRVAGSAQLSSSKEITQ